MKKIIPFFLFLLSACSHVQLLEVCSDSEVRKGSEDSKSFFIYSSDSANVKYNFWAENGVMGFSVFNNLNIPIYLDLKKSAYISNGNKFDYWQDETNTASVGLYQSYSYKGITIGSRKSYSTQTRKQRIVSIPPHSYTSFNDFLICPNTEFEMYGEKSKDYSSADSPVRFRNYLVLSTTEDFKSEFYLDNDFYVCKIKEMKKKDFQGDMVQYGNKVDYEYPYSNFSSFYILYIKKQNTGTNWKNWDL